MHHELIFDHNLVDALTDPHIRRRRHGCRLVASALWSFGICLPVFLLMSSELCSRIQYVEDGSSNSMEATCFCSMTPHIVSEVLAIKAGGDGKMIGLIKQIEEVNFIRQFVVHHNIYDMDFNQRAEAGLFHQKWHRTLT